MLQLSRLMENPNVWKTGDLAKKVIFISSQSEVHPRKGMEQILKYRFELMTSE